MDAAKTGALIAQARKEKGLTQGQLAQRLHVSVQAVSKWERGRNFPDLALLEPLAEALDLTVSELLAGERGEPPQETAVREALRVGIQQLRRQVLRFRALLLCAGLVLAVFLCARGFLWVRDHTELLPQPVTTVTARPMSDQARLTAWTASGGHLRIPGLFQVSLADQRTPYLLQWELWDHQGLRQTWEVGRTACPEDFPRHQDLATSVGMTMDPDRESWSTLTYTVSFLDETFTGALEAVPRLYDTYGVEQPAGRCPVDEAEGTILLYLPLPNEEGQMAVPWWTTPGQIELPVRKSFSVLLLKLYVL